MNAVEIEEAVSALASEPFDAGEFPYAFLAAFGNKETTVKRLRSGSSNSSDVPGGVLQRNNIHMAVCAPGEVGATFAALRLRALSRYRMKNARGLRLAYFHATATAARHMFIADALKARCVLADVRWRWTLKVLYVAAWVERNLCADPTVLNPCIFLSLRRVG